MAIPFVYLAGQGILAAGRFALPRIIAAAPSIKSGLMATGSAIFNGGRLLISNPVTNNPIKSVLAAGAVNHATGGAVGDAALAIGEGAVTVGRAVLPAGATQSIGQGVLGATAYVANGYKDLGESIIDRYGDKALEALPDIPLPKGIGIAIQQAKSNLPQGGNTAGGAPIPAGEVVRDVVADGNITVDESRKPGNSFRDRVTETAEAAQAAPDAIEEALSKSPFGQRFLYLGAMASDEAKNNPFVWAGLALGGLQGYKNADGAVGKAIKPIIRALFMAALFAGIGHYAFGYKSKFFEEVKFGELLDGMRGHFNAAMSGVRGAAPATYREEIRPFIARTPSLTPN